MHATENPAFVGDAGEPQYDRYTENDGSRVTSEVQKAINDDRKLNKNQFTDVSLEAHNSTTTIHLNQSDEITGQDNISSASDSKRDTWGSGVEFLFSCIAMSVGLGNVWRFPFIAFKNGGGAFLLPYLIVLYIIGKPSFFLEMVVGQFSSRGPTKVYDLCPAMRGVGTGQVLSLVFVITYYSAIIGLILKYLVSSFTFNLPWIACRPEWGPNCTSAASTNLKNVSNFSGYTSSAELFFKHEIFRNQTLLHEGIGEINWEMIGYLALGWIILLLILVKGIKSSGKISYFLAIFPYIMLSLLLFNTMQLPGAWDGLREFFTPQWSALLNPQVWYEAVVQAFFSLGVCYVMIIAYSSYNKFDHKIQIDANIVTTIDTFTSLLSGCCVFSVLGYLKHELGASSIQDVMKPGPGLAFITYPEAISKFGVAAPYLSVAFFLMFFTLGMGSLVAMISSITTSVRDHFTKVTHLQGITGLAVFGTIFGSIYFTQSGMDLLDLVDYYCATTVIINLVIFELATFCYIYGVDRLCKDIKFMLNFEPGYYWTTCWRYLTPGLTLLLVLFYYASLFKVEEVEKFPLYARVFGYILTFACLCHLPLIMLYETYYAEGKTYKEKFRSAFRPKPDWGPRDSLILEEYKVFMEKSKPSNIILSQ